MLTPNLHTTVRYPCVEQLRCSIFWGGEYLGSHSPFLTSHRVCDPYEGWVLCSLSSPALCLTSGFFFFSHNPVQVDICVENKSNPLLFFLLGYSKLTFSLLVSRCFQSIFVLGILIVPFVTLTDLYRAWVLSSRRWYFLGVCQWYGERL